MTMPASDVTPGVLSVDRPLVRTGDRLWRMQAAGLLAITVATFFPAWSHLQEYVFLVLALLAGATAYAEGRPLWFPSPLHLPLLLFIGWVALSLATATDPLYSFGEWRKLAVKMLLFYWAVNVWRIALASHPGGQDSRFMQAIAVGSTIVCLYALFDFIQRGGTWTDRPVRARGPSSDYQWLSTYMVMALPVMLAAAWQSRHVIARWSYAGIAMLSLAAQALSYTRAGWLGLAAQGLAFALFTKRYKLLLGVVFGIVVTLALLAGFGRFGYQQDTLDPWTFQARVAVWSLMAEDIAAHPFLGVGYGTKTYMARFGERPESAKAGGSHNFFLMVAMGSGIPALLLLIWILAVCVRECLRLSKALAQDRVASALLMATALMIVGFAVRNIFDTMFAGSLACLFWLMVAAALAHTPFVPAAGPRRAEHVA